jgi:hypothetical protein
MNLTAVVVDRASGPIKDIQRTLQGTVTTGTQDTDKLTIAGVLSHGLSFM